MENVHHAMEYVRSQLEDGVAEELTLPKLILDQIDLTRGAFYLATPSELEQNDLDLESEVPGLRDQPIEFARMIRRFISGPTCAVLIQDQQASHSAKWLEGEKYLDYVIRYKNEVYWRLVGARLSEGDILHIVRSKFPYPFGAYFYTENTSSGKDMLDNSDLERIIDSLCGVAVAAFDAESFLVWWRSGGAVFPG